MWAFLIWTLFFRIGTDRRSLSNVFSSCSTKQRKELWVTYDATVSRSSAHAIQNFQGSKRLTRVNINCSLKKERLIIICTSRVDDRTVSSMKSSYNHETTQNYSDFFRNAHAFEWCAKQCHHEERQMAQECLPEIHPKLWWQSRRRFYHYNRRWQQRIHFSSIKTNEFIQILLYNIIP